MHQAHKQADQIEETVDLLEQFSTLLDQETVAVTSYRTDDFLALQDRKKLLATLYVEKVSALKTPDGTQAQFDAASAAQLREAHGRFETATAANLRALAAAGGSGQANRGHRRRSRALGSVGQRSRLWSTSHQSRRSRCPGRDQRECDPVDRRTRRRPSAGRPLRRPVAVSDAGHARKNCRYRLGTNCPTDRRSTFLSA